MSLKLWLQKNFHVLITLLILMSSLAMSKSQRQSQSRELITIPPHTDTIILLYNFVTNRKDGMTIHCKSKDDDLGSHTVAPAAFWSFRFRPNVFDGTLFFCHVTAPGVLPAAGHYFDAYDQKRDSGQCPNLECCLNVYPAGPCHCNTGVCYPWKS